MARIALTDAEFRQSILDRFGNPHNVIVMPGAYQGAKLPLTYHCPDHGEQTVWQAGKWKGRCKVCSFVERSNAQRHTRASVQALLDEHYGRRHLTLLSDPGDLGEGRSDRRMRFVLKCEDVHPWGPPFTRILYHLQQNKTDCPLCAKERQHRQYLTRLGLKPAEADAHVFARREVKRQEILKAQLRQGVPICTAS